MERSWMDGTVSELELSDIVDPSYLQAMHEIFSDDMRAAGITVTSAIFNKDASPITFGSNYCSFCKKIKETEAGEKQCKTSNQRGMKLAERHWIETGKLDPVFYICDQGLIDFCAPIVVKDNIIGYFFGGQLKGICNYEDTILKTPDSPIFENLLRELTPEKISEAEIKNYTTKLRTEFKNMQTLQEAEFDKLKKAAGVMAQQLNFVIRKLDEAKRVEVVEGFMQRAVVVPNINSLFDLMVDNLPEMMEAKYCSIFTVQQGETKDDDRLVLRKTNYPQFKPEENSAYYKRGQGLTGWVWENARSLRLSDVNSEVERAQYPGLSWARTHNDSDEHKGFLCVPMTGRNGQVIGVIRMPHKTRKTGIEKGFTKYDEIFLNFLAHHLSRAIECQELEDRFQYAINKGLLKAAVELARTTSYEKVFEQITKHLVSLFGGGQGKKYFVNLHTIGSDRWKVKCIEGDLELSGKWKNRVLYLNDGLTGKVIHEKRPILLYDLEKAKKEGYYVEAVVGGRSAMAAPLQYRDKTYGVIAVVSDKEFSFSWEKELKILEIFAELSAAAIIRSRWFYIITFVRRLCIFFRGLLLG